MKQTLIAALCLISVNLLAQQDTLYFNSGERIIGEIKSLEMGNMKFDTDEMGVVNVDWDDVARLKSFGLYEITLKNRTKHFGTFDFGDSAKHILLVEETGTRVTINPEEVISVGSIETSFRSKIDGSLSIGLSYTKASDVLQYNAGGRISFKDKKLYTQLSGSIVVTEQETKANTRKSNLNYNLRYSFVRRWFVGMALGAEQNYELGLDQRLTGGFAIGNDFVYTQVHRLYGQVGSIINVERAVDSAAVKQSFEGAISAGYLLYNSGIKDLYLDVNVITYPSFTITDRWRGEININPKIEIIADLNFGLSYYYIFDTKPLVETASEQDWGVLTTLSYSF